MITIDELLKNYESRSDKLLIPPREREYLVMVLQSISEFSLVIGMQDCFENNFGQILFCVQNSSVILDCLNANSRYCPDMQKAIKLFVLIVALQNDCVNPDDLDEVKIAALVDIKDIEESIEENLKRDRSVEAALFFFNSMLNTLVFKDNEDQYITITIEQLTEMEEAWITESALMAMLGTFQLLREFREKKIPVKAKIPFFKLYYLYYSDVYFCLSHDKFTHILDGFFTKYSKDGRQFTFFCSLMKKLMENLKKTDLLDEGSFYREKLIHPFEMLDNFYDIPFGFYERIQKEKNDYAKNSDKYSKDLKELLYYAWDEADYAYIVAKRYAENTDISVEEVQKFSRDLFDVILNTYYETGMLPTSSLLSFFAQKAQSSGVEDTNNTAETLPFLAKFLSQDTLGGAFDKVINVVKTNIGNETIANLLDNGMLKNTMTNWLQSASSKVGSSVQSGISSQLPTISFSTISSGVIFFWKSFNKSHDLKNMALQGKGNEIVDQFVGAIKSPAMNMVGKGLEKIPYGSLVNSSNIGQAMGALLGGVQSFIGAKQTVPEAPFTSGEGAVKGFAKNNKTKELENKKPTKPLDPEDAF